jgi:hypothetical protein
MLTDSLDDFQFDFDLMKAGSDDTCPIDHFGTLK